MESIGHRQDGLLRRLRYRLGCLAAFVAILTLTTPAFSEPVELSYGNIDIDPTGAGTVEILMENFVAVSGFQFELSGFEITGVSAGAAAGWDINLNGLGVVVVEPNGGFLFADEYTLLVVDVQVVDRRAQLSCVEAAIFSDPGGRGLPTRSTCANLGSTVEFRNPIQVGEGRGTLEVWVTNSVYPIRAFQAEVDGVELLGVGGGETANTDWGVSTNERGFVGTHLTGGTLAQGEHLLTVISFEVEPELGSVCLTDVKISDEFGVGQRIENNACENLGVTVEIGDVNILANEFDLRVRSPFYAISGFQVGLSGINMTGASGGRSALWSMSSRDGYVVGLDLNGVPIDKGDYTLTVVGFELGDAQVCIDSGRFSNPLGRAIAIDLGECKSLLEGNVPEPAFRCSVDAPYQPPSVSLFVPGMFPGEQIQLCPLRAATGTGITNVGISLVSPELPGESLTLVSETYGAPRPAVLPYCGDGVGFVEWGDGSEACDSGSGDVLLTRGTPAGNYVLHYEIVVEGAGLTSIATLDVPWVRIDLPGATSRILEALDGYLEPVVGIIPLEVAGNDQYERTRDRAESSTSLYAHARAAYEHGAMSTVFAAISDVHEPVVGVRNEFNDSFQSLHYPEHGDEVGQLLHELYRSAALESRDYLVIERRISLDSTVNARFQRAGAVMDAVRSAGSANPVVDIAWGFSRQLALIYSATREVEQDISSRRVPSASKAVELVRMVRDSAEDLREAIDASSGVMFGDAENDAVLAITYELEPLLTLLSFGGGSNFERGTMISRLFDLVQAVQDARLLGHLGNDDQLYFNLLAIYTGVKNLLPNAEANICAHSGHPWYEENAFRWDYLEEELVQFRATQEEVHLSNFVRAALGVEGDWKRLRTEPSLGLDPFDDLGLATTMCGILYIYSAAYSSDEPEWDTGGDGNDNCYYDAEGLSWRDCAAFRVDHYASCGDISASHAMCGL